MNRRGKPRRTKYKMTTTSAWKRAVVVLEENSRIELF
jgi:ribosomal protein L23